MEFRGFHHYYLIKVTEHIASEGATLKGVSTARINKKQVPMPSAETAWHKKKRNSIQVFLNNAPLPTAEIYPEDDLRPQLRPSPNTAPPSAPPAPLRP